MSEKDLQKELDELDREAGQKVDDLDGLPSFKQTAVGFGKSLTTNHFTRLVNKGTRNAFKAGKQISQEIKQGKKYQVCCPYCSQVFLDYVGDGVWGCKACEASYDVGGGTLALHEFIAIHGREIYLQGKGKDNTAYTRHGFDEKSEVQTLAQINLLYWGSRFVLLLAIFVFIQVFRATSLLLAWVFVLLFFSTLLYSMYYAYRAYCLATRQMFIYGRWHFIWWLANVGLFYFIHVGKKPEYQMIVDDFELAEQTGVFDQHRYKANYEQDDE